MSAIPVGPPSSAPVTSRECQVQHPPQYAGEHLLISVGANVIRLSVGTLGARRRGSGRRDLGRTMSS